MTRQYEKFFEICRKYKKSCGIFDPDPESVRRDKKLGANVFWIGDDISYLRAGFEALRKEL